MKFDEEKSVLTRILKGLPTLGKRSLRKTTKEKVQQRKNRE
jgi:hypothetical protein